MSTKKLLILPMFLFPLVIMLSQCLSTKKEVADPRGKAYAGAKACISCHSNIANTYPHMAHSIASSWASVNSVHGSFAAGRNSLTYNDHTKLLMTKTDSGLFQTSYINGEKVASERMAIA